jgi:hypothetical protein
VVIGKCFDDDMIDAYELYLVLLGMPHN